MTALEMLWERVDPARALTERFGFAGVEDATAWLGDTVTEGWSVRSVRCDRLVISATSLLAWLTVDGQDVIAKCTADPARFARLAEVDALLTWLDERGLPVAAPIAAGDGHLRVGRDTISVGLCPVIAGNLLDVDDPGQVEAAGRMLATLHRTLATYPRTIGEQRPADGQQLVQGDYRSANILHDGLAITAVLDFDDATTRSPMADLAHSAVLLGTRYHDWTATSPRTRQAFVAAYDEIAPLTAAQRDALGRGVAAVLVHFGWT